MPNADRVPERPYDLTGRIFILGALAVALYFSWKVLRPFLSAIAIAAILDVVCYPLYARLRRAFGGRRAPAAGVTVFGVVLCVILPLTVMGFLFTKQALDLYQLLTTRAADGGLESIMRFRNWDAVEGWLATHAPWLDVQALNLKEIFLNFLGKVSGFGVTFGKAVAANVLSALGTFAVVLFSLFFFLLDGGAFGRWIAGLVPLNDKHQQELTRTFVGIVKSAVLGSGLIALAQGLLGGVAFSLVGLRGVLWGSVMAFTSLVPVVGTAIVWIPASIVLLALGHTGGAVFLLVWGAVVISGVDNVIRMFVIQGPVRMHPLLIFFSVLGGIKVAGLLGVVFGPLALALVLALLEIYRVEFLSRPPA